MNGALVIGNRKIVVPSQLQFYFAEGSLTQEMGDHVKVVYFVQKGGLLIGEVGVIVTKAHYNEALTKLLPRAIEAASNARGLFSVN